MGERESSSEVGFLARVVEPGPGFGQGLRDLRGSMTPKGISAGIVAAVFGCTGPALIIIEAAGVGGLTDGQTVAWLLACYLIGGLISFIMAIGYRMPIGGAFSIPGAAIMAAALTTFSFPEAVGAFVMAGVLVLLIGISGGIRRLMRMLPMPIVMAMIAGALIRFGVGAVEAAAAAPLVGGFAVLAFFLTTRYAPRMSPILAALLVGLVAAFATGSISVGATEFALTAPELTEPKFTLQAFLGISIPLAALVIGAENAQAIGVLIAEKYDPPINAMTIISGIGGIVAGFLGGHNANIAGPSTAICASEQAGERPNRYAAAVVFGVLFGAFGLVASVAVPIVLALPGELIAVVAGLAMIGVLLSAFQQGFSRQLDCQVGALVALVVAMSKFTLLSISSPFWALVFGALTSLLLKERRSVSARGRERATSLQGDDALSSPE